MVLSWILQQSLRFKINHNVYISSEHTWIYWMFVVQMKMKSLITTYHSHKNWQYHTLWNMTIYSKIIHWIKQKYKLYINTIISDIDITSMLCIIWLGEVECKDYVIFMYLLPPHTIHPYQIHLYLRNLQLHFRCCKYTTKTVSLPHGLA